MQSNLLTILILAVALFVAACTPGAPANTTTPTEAVAPAESADTDTAGIAESDTVSTTEEVAEEEEEDATDAAQITKLNLNTVSGDELLATIPDFGNRMVREFQEYRPYVSIQQFRREIGKYVDDSQVAFYEEYVYVPVSANDSDADTLMQIPGIDEAAAEALIAARPFGSNDAFLQAVAEVAPDVDPAVAQAYLETE